MIRLFKYTTAKLWLLLLLLIILAGIMVAVGRFVAPLAELYRTDVEQWASRALGQPVEMGFLEGHWRGLGPELTLHNVALLNPDTGKTTLKLDEIKLRVSLLESVKNRSVTLRKITLVNPRLLIKRRSDGTIIIEGLHDLGDQQGAAGGALLLPANLALKNGVIDWENQAIGAPPLRFSDVDMELRNDGDHHQFTGSLTLPGEFGGRLTLAADITGELDQPDAWSGEAYLKGQQLILARLLKPRLPEGYSFESGHGQIEVWSGWEKGRLHQLLGNVKLSEIDLIRQAEDDQANDRSWVIDQLGGNFQWQRNPRGWALGIHDILFEHQAGRWPETQLFIRTDRRDDGGLQLEAGAGFLRIEDLLEATSMFPLPDPTLEEALATISPRGDISELRINYQETPEGPDWQAAGTVQSLSTQPWKKVPGVENLSARLWSDGQQGIIRLLDTGSLALEFPQLFRDPLEIERIQGIIRWHPLENGSWRIESGDLLAANDDIHTMSRFRLDLPLDDPASANLNLQTDFENGNAINAPRYYPVGIMPEDAVKWLDRSFLDGRVTSGSAIFRGPLNGFPFDKDHSGRFEVLFNVTGLDLAYWPEWPELKDLEAEVRFLNNRFDTWISKGLIYDSRIIQAHGTIPDLERIKPLRVTGQIEGALKDTFRLLRESPLKENFGPMTRDIEAGGNSNLKLDLTVPLRQKDSYRLFGQLAFLESSLDLKAWQLPLFNIGGLLEFDLDHVHANDIQGTLFGNPIRANVSASPEVTDATRIEAVATLSRQDLQKRFPHPHLERMSGKGEIALQIDLPNISGWEDAAVPLRVASDLKGFRIDLPSPLGKTEEEERSLSISTRITDTPQHSVTIDYGNLLSAALLLEDKGEETLLRGADLVLGPGKAGTATTGKVDISGGWQRLDLATWLELFANKEGPGEKPLLGNIDLRFDHLVLNDIELEQFELNLTRHNAELSGSFASNRFKGTAQIPDDLDNRPIALQLKHLDLVLEPDSWSAEEETAGDTQESLDPTEFPSLNASIDKVRINDKDYGRFTLKAQRQAAGINLEQLSLVSDTTRLNGSGIWTTDDQGDQTSSLDIRLDSDNFGALLEDFGFTANLEEAAAEIDSRISWQGSPMLFSLDKLNGQLALRLGEGRFLEVEPGVGRIFGLLNISALHRRLTLDFSDMVKEGFSFDRIEGDFQIENGNAYTENFRMRGPSANIDIAGRIGLGAEDFDQLITVTPMISSSLPLAGAWAGGPAVGAALLLAQKLFGDKFDKATRIQYQATGPWSDPVLTELKREIEKEEEDQLIDPALLSPSAR
ncbi:MAG: YhdP family protein [Sedimenticola sp.]